MKIKVCGITGFGQMEQLQQLGIDYAGMIFYKGSKRFVGEKMRNEKLKIKNLQIKKTGVFVNAEVNTIKQAINDYGLNAVQLHGDETVEFCQQFMNITQVIKVLQIEKEKNIDALVQPFQNACHYFLFDTPTKEYGGSGEKFDWKTLEQANISKPFFLSGGIALEDAVQIKKFQHPHFYAVDINSRFEIEPGIKDMKKVQSFVQLFNHE